MTICRECRHFLSNGPIWYDQFCRASPLTVGIDPVSGLSTRLSTNDLGRCITTDEWYNYARDINTTGACKLFEVEETPPPVVE